MMAEAEPADWTINGTEPAVVPIPPLPLNAPAAAVNVPVVVRLEMVGLVASTTAPDPVDVVPPVPPLATANVPVTPVVSGSPPQFVNVPDAGVPSAGATNVLLLNVSEPASVASVPSVAGRVRITEACCARTVLKAPVVAKFPARANVPVVTVRPVPPALTTIARLAVSGGILSNADAMAANSARCEADEPGE